jgi:hypothetical protein
MLMDLDQIHATITHIQQEAGYPASTLHTGTLCLGVVISLHSEFDCIHVLPAHHNTQHPPRACFAVCCQRQRCSHTEQGMSCPIQMLQKPSQCIPYTTQRLPCML